MTILAIYSFLPAFNTTDAPSRSTHGQSLCTIYPYSFSSTWCQEVGLCQSAVARRWNSIARQSPGRNRTRRLHVIRKVSAH